MSAEQGPTYESLRAAWEQMKEPVAAGPMVFHPDHLAILEEHCVVQDGRLSIAALLDFAREVSS